MSTVLKSASSVFTEQTVDELCTQNQSQDFNGRPRRLGFHSETKSDFLARVCVRAPACACVRTSVRMFICTCMCLVSPHLPIMVIITNACISLNRHTIIPRPLTQQRKHCKPIPKTSPHVDGKIQTIHVLVNLLCLVEALEIDAHLVWMGTNQFGFQIPYIKCPCRCSLSGKWKKEEMQGAGRTEGIEGDTPLLSVSVHFPAEPIA